VGALEEQKAERLAASLAPAPSPVRCLVRDRGGTRARELEREGFDLHEGGVLRPETLRGAGHGVDVAYYLIHSVGRSGPKNAPFSAATPESLPSRSSRVKRYGAGSMTRRRHGS
jgi:uncharacterized protein YbjT (DUF2867 family)